VFGVDSNDQIVEKRVKLGEQRGGDWIVLDGIDAGARIIASGVQKAQPGEKVKPVPYQSNATDAAAAAGTSGG
jgi:membrane fusion protein (multidrug efflux system)